MSSTNDLRRKTLQSTSQSSLIMPPIIQPSDLMSPFEFSPPRRARTFSGKNPKVGNKKKSNGETQVNNVVDHLHSSSSEQHSQQIERVNVDMVIPTNPKSIRKKSENSKKRGVVNGTNLSKAMSANNDRKLKIEVGPDGINPFSSTLASLLSHAIGCVVREQVPMIASSFCKLPEEINAISIVYNHLKAFFDDLDPPAKWLDNFIWKQSIERYKDWKHECKLHYIDYPTELPLEFIDRPEQWVWLVQHFNDPKYKKKCCDMTVARSKKKRNHHGGKLSLAHRAARFRKKGIKAPLIAAVEEIYAGDSDGAILVEKIKEKARELHLERGHDADNSDVFEELATDDEVDIIDEVFEKKKRKKVIFEKSSGKHGMIHTQAEFDKMKEELQKNKEEAATATATAAAAESAAAESAAKVTTMEIQINALKEIMRSAGLNVDV